MSVPQVSVNTFTAYSPTKEKVVMTLVVPVSVVEVVEERSL
jgi:hypothetical protein